MFGYFLITSILLSNLMLGLLVYSKNPKETVNRNFFKVVFWTMVWISSNFLENELALRKYSHLLLKIDFATAIILAYYFCLFCINFPKKIKFSLARKLILGLPALLLFVLSFSSLVVRNINFNLGSINFERGILYWLYALVVFGYIGIGSLNLSFRLRKMVGIEKMQTIYILLGLTLSATSAIFFNLILTQISVIPAGINRMGIYGILFFVFLSAYAILRHRLFNVRVIATELLVFAIWIFTLIRLLLSEGYQERIINVVFLALLIVSGVLLIRSVLKEVRQREEIQKLSEFKTELLSVVAHQIKNPLIVIKGYASLVEDKTICDAEAVSDVFKKIKAAADKLVMLLNNLLDLHHFEEGKMHYEFQKIELNKFLKDIVEGFRIIARQRNFDLVFEPSSSEVYVSGDIYKLSQVFQNLIDNAIKYTEKGWIKVSVDLLSLPADKQETPSVKDKEEAVITVSDSGKGMNRDLAQKLFQKFSRGAGESKALGSGLGLYISKEIVEAHHGKIWAESEGEGKGSKFLVKLLRVS